MSGVGEGSREPEIRASASGLDGATGPNALGRVTVERSLGQDTV